MSTQPSTAAAVKPPRSRARAPRGFGSVKRRQRGGRVVWEAAYPLPAGPDGRRREQSKTFSSQRAARGWLSAMAADNARGTLSADPRVTLDAWLSTWLDSRTNVRPSTARFYRDMVAHLRPRLGRHRVAELRPVHVEKAYSGMIRDGHSPALVHAVHRTLRAALSVAERDNLIARNPARFATLPARPHREMSTWTPAQARDFLEFVREERLFPLWRLLLSTGMRRGEALGLTWEDLDLDAGALTVRQQVSVVGGQIMRGEPKTAKGHRVLLLDPATVAALRSWRAASAAQRLVAGAAWAGDAEVFTDASGAVLRPEYVTRRFKALATRAGLPPIRLHDTRHSHATALLDNGVGVHVVSDRLGHSTTSVTMNAYAHVQGAARADAARVAGALLETPPAAIG